jgi:hypothetical protein
MSLNEPRKTFEEEGGKQEVIGRESAGGEMQNIGKQIIDMKAKRTDDRTTRKEELTVNDKGLSKFYERSASVLQDVANNLFQESLVSFSFFFLN